MLTKRSLSNRKHEWKVQKDSVANEAERLELKARAGDIVTIGEVYKLAWRINELGERAHVLYEAASRLDFRPSVLEDIGQGAHELELYSLKVRNIAYKRNLTLKIFPNFTSNLPYLAVNAEDSDPLNELAEIMQRPSEDN